MIEKINSIERDNEDETKWSLNSNDSQDEGFSFQKSNRLSNKAEESSPIIPSNKYLYDNFEEILDQSDNEDDERLFIDQTRISFTRDQLLQYQQLIKLLRLIKNGGRCITLLSLALLRDQNLSDQCAYHAFEDCSMLNIFLNFLQISDRDIKLNTLNVLKDACANPFFAHEIFRLGGIECIIQSITFDHIGIEESCQILLKILSFHRARRVIRRSGGIGRLIYLLDQLTENIIDNTRRISDLFSVFILICKSEKNQYVFIRYGIGSILLRIIDQIPSESLILFLSLLLQKRIFRLQILNKNLLLTLINSIDRKNMEFTRMICEALYYLSLDSNIYQIIPENDLRKFEELFEENTDPSIFCSILNISKEKNVNFLRNILQYIRISSDRFYLSRIFQSLNQFLSSPQTIELFKQENIYSIFLQHLHNSFDHESIQSDLLSILQISAKDPSSARMIVEENGFQQFWTLFKSSSMKIRISAGWTIRNCLISIENHGELIRSFDGIFYFISKSLSTENIQLLTVTLAIIAEIVKDRFNLQIITDLGIPEKISQLNQLENIQLRQAFTDAVANLLDHPSNQDQFGNRRILTILQTYLNDSNEQLYPSLTKSFVDLSHNPSNCILLHELGIASDLLSLIGNDQNLVQENAANTLRNLRKLI